MDVANNADDFHFVGNTASSSEFGVFLDGHIDAETLEHVDGQNFSMDGSLWFVDTTAYANREVGLWSFKGNASDNFVVVQDAKLSDNASNLEIRGDDLLFIDSVSIGESDNIATDRNQPNIGVKTYRNSDAAMVDVHFANFDDHFGDIAISLQQGELKDYGDRFERITFENVDNELIFRDITALLRPDDAFNTVARDDGSLTDVAGGAWITRNIPGETERAGYNAYADPNLDNAWITTEGAMGVTEFYLYGKGADRQKEITVTRSVDGLKFDQDSWLTRDGRGGEDLYQFITPTADFNQEGGFLVEVGGPGNVFPTGFHLSLDGIRVGEAVVYEIPNIASFSSSFDVNDVNSMADLFAAESTSAFLQGGSLFVRVVGMHAADETYIGAGPNDQLFGEYMGTESPFGYAVYFDVTPLNRGHRDFQAYGEAVFDRDLLNALDQTDGFVSTAQSSTELFLPDAPAPHETHPSTSDTIVVADRVSPLDNGTDLPVAPDPDNMIRGTDGDETLSGGQANDALYGSNGDDLLRGNNGDDAAYGGKGDDNLQGGSGNDTLEGGEGTDYLAGSYGDDLVSGGAGPDEVYGDYGIDVLYGDAGNDKVGGGDGADILFGGTGNDSLIGGLGDYSGNDILVGGLGADLLNGGAGDDVYVFETARDSTANSRDTIQQFSVGEDTIDVSLLGITGIDDLTITLSGNQTIVRHNGSQFEVLIQGRHALQESNFVFAETDTPQEVASGMARWSDPSAWNGAVPGSDDIVVVGHGQTVVLDASTTVKGIIIAGGNLLVEDAAADAPEIKLITDYVLVIEGGLFQAGTERNPLDREFTLELTGDDPDMDLDVGRILDGGVANTVFAQTDAHDAPGTGTGEPIEVPVLPVDPSPIDGPVEPVRETGVVSGRIFVDAEKDGVFDPEHDDGLSEVQVSLLRDGVRVATAETDSRGIVRFEDIDAGGGYSLRFDDEDLEGGTFAPMDAQFIGGDGRLNTDAFDVSANDGVWRIARVHEVEAAPVNRAPVAEDDAVTLLSGDQAVVDVLANDVDPDRDALTITAVDASDGLRAQIRGDTVRVIAEDGFIGDAVVAYTVRDVHGASGTGRIEVDVAGPPEPETGTVSGRIFVDADRDDAFSEGDMGLGGVRVSMLRDGVWVASAETNEFGVVHFGEVEAGPGYSLRFHDDDLGDGTLAPREWQTIDGAGRLNTDVFEVTAGDQVWRTARTHQQDAPTEPETGDVNASSSSMRIGMAISAREMLASAA
ncbi:MAG: G8 domain-containing protein [Pseudomonadota bacterium]